MQYIKENHARRIAGTPASAANGLECKYFLSEANDTYRGSRNPVMLLEMAVQANAANYIVPTDSVPGSFLGNYLTGGRLKIMQTSFYQSHRVINQCNFAIKLTSYYCSTRRHMPPNAYLAPLNILGRGFAMAKNNTAAPDSTNVGLVEPQLSPFNSSEFCQAYRILKNRTKYLQPADFANFAIKDNRTFEFDPTTIQPPTSNTTIYNVALPLYDHYKGETFYLFRIEPAQTGENNGTDNITSLAPVVHIITKSIAAFKAYQPQSQSSVNFSSYGYVNAGANVDVVNDETNATVFETPL